MKRIRLILDSGSIPGISTISRFSRLGRVLDGENKSQAMSLLLMGMKWIRQGRKDKWTIREGDLVKQPNNSNANDDVYNVELAIAA